MNFIGRYFWLIGIVMSFVNYFIIMQRMNRNSQEINGSDPEVQELVKINALYYLVIQNIPLAVMGVGIMSGNVEAVWNFFRPQDKNPYVLLFFGSAVLCWLAGAYWIFLKRGAEKIADHPGVIFTKPVGSVYIKILWIGMAAGGIAGFVAVWYMNIPMPNMLP